MEQEIFDLNLDMKKFKDKIMEESEVALINDINKGLDIVSKARVKVKEMGNRMISYPGHSTPLTKEQDGTYDSLVENFKVEMYKFSDTLNEMKRKNPSRRFQEIARGYRDKIDAMEEDVFSMDLRMDEMAIIRDELNNWKGHIEGRER